MSLVSIIIPCYNVESYIKDALRSVLKQSYKNIEIICVDDCSQDKTVFIIKRFMKKDKRIVLIENSQNFGVGKTRQIGLDNATGKYIMWLDPDDIMDYRMVAYMVGLMEYQKCDFCNTAYSFISGKLFIGRSVFFKSLYLRGKHKLSKSNVFYINNLLWNKIFKKSIIDKYHITFPEVRMSEDTSFCLKYFSVSKTAFFSNAPLYFHRFRDKSLVSDRAVGLDNAYVDDSLLAINEARNFVEKHNPKLLDCFDEFFKMYGNYLIHLVNSHIKNSLENILKSVKKNLN